MSAGGSNIRHNNPVQSGNFAQWTADDAVEDSGIPVAGADVVAGTAYTLTAADNGRTKSFTNGSGVTLTVNAGVWKASFQTGLIQSGAAAVTPTAGANVTITQRQSHTATAGQGAFAALIADPATTDHWIFAGDTA